MQTITSAIEAYLQIQLREIHHPLCLVLDPQQCLRSWSGEPEYYGIAPLARGVAITTLLPFLDNALAGQARAPLVLPPVTMANGRWAHTHLVPDDNGWAVLLLDATREREDPAAPGQIGDELRLLERRQAELLNHLRQAHAALEKKNHELDRANRAKSQFIAQMSHEFRTPLTSVLGYSRLLRETLPASPQTTSYLDAVERGGQHLLTLVDNLLEQAGIEAGAVEIRPVATNLGRLFRELLDLIRPLTRDKGLALEFEAQVPLPARVMVDQLRLRQILINLLGNAAKFTHSGSIRVQAQWHWDQLSVAVRDTGPGIPPEARSRIFDAFEHNVTASQPRQKGTGLGLAISRELAQRMGGDLVLEGSGPEGSCFRVSVPAPASSELARTRPVDQTYVAESVVVAADQPSSIVVAEDDPDIRALMELYLEHSPYRVRFAEDGMQAAQMILEEPPDLVLMDVQMPKMDGISAARKLRQEGFRGPIVALTGASHGTWQEQAALAGCDHCLTKPLDMEQLLATIRTLLDFRTTEQQRLR